MRFIGYKNKNNKKFNMGVYYGKSLKDDSYIQYRVLGFYGHHRLNKLSDAIYLRNRRTIKFLAYDHYYYDYRRIFWKKSRRFFRKIKQVCNRSLTINLFLELVEDLYDYG